MEDVFAIQDEIAQGIARALRVVLTEEEKHKIEKVSTSNIQAACAREWAKLALAMAPDEATVLYNIARTYALLDDETCPWIAWKKR
ncbi:MAG TPA: hypothetical protein VF532_15440 [Candidatus Angelobacter sp.]